MNDCGLSNGYYLTKGIITSDKDKHIIPIWDKRITYEDHELYGLSYNFNNRRQELRDIVLNLATKELSLGIEINIYPQQSDFKIGQSVYVKIKDSVYKSSIKDILYTEYNISIYKGKNLEEYFISYIKKQYPHIQITIDGLYYIKDWIPYYLLQDDRLIKWRSELFKEFVNE